MAAITSQIPRVTLKPGEHLYCVEAVRGRRAEFFYYVAKTATGAKSQARKGLKPTLKGYEVEVLSAFRIPDQLCRRAR